MGKDRTELVKVASLLETDPAYTVEAVLGLRAECERLRCLAWSWCIEATDRREGEEAANRAIDRLVRKGEDHV